MVFMERKLRYVVFPDDGVFVARCLDVEVASDGRTELEAVANLQQALELYFEDGEATMAELPPRRYRFGEVVVSV